MDIREYIAVDTTSPTGLVWIKRRKSNMVGSPAFTTVNGGGYYCGMFNSKRVLAHRVVFYLVNGHWPSMTDHMDGNRQNNNPLNLREVTALENQQNQQHCRGWSLHRGRYRVQIRVNKVLQSVGMFDTPEEARKAYLDAKGKYHNGWCKV